MCALETVAEKGVRRSSSSLQFPQQFAGVEEAVTRGCKCSPGT